MSELEKLTELVLGLHWQADRLRKENEEIRLLLGGVVAELKASREDPAGAEFRAFSQFGEDGILAWLLKRIEIPNKVFVEFGVENFTESNTRFLLRSDPGWRGLILDGSEEHMAFVRREEWFWRHHLSAVAAFVTRENINDLFRDHGVEGDIGILSVDIDGNDLWVWEAIDCISPRIVVCEYNSLFGPDRAVALPYDPGFDMFKAHYSGLYWGASLKAFNYLAERKGYRLVVGNTTGHNAFFVREDLCAGLPTPSVAEAWRPPQFRIGRTEAGELSYFDWQRNQEILRGMKVLEWESTASDPVEATF